MGALARGQLLPRRAHRRGRAVLDLHPAAERDCCAPPRARAQQHAAGRPHAPLPHEGHERHVDAGHGPRRHRHADGGGAAPPAAGQAARGLHAPAVHRQGPGVEGRVRGHHPQPAEGHGRLLRLRPRPLHHGPGVRGRRAHRVLQALRRRPRLPRQAPRELGPGHAHCARRRRGGDGGSGRPLLVPPLPVRGRFGPHHRGHHAPRDHARRHRRGREPQGPARRRAAREEAAPPHRRPRDPHRRRRLRGHARRIWRRPRRPEGAVRHRLPEGDARARPQRLGDRPAPRRGRHQHHGARRLHQRQARLGGRLRGGARLRRPLA